MIDIVLAVVIIVILTSAFLYVRKEKKKGVKCIGCSESCNCSKDKCE